MELLWTLDLRNVTAAATVDARLKRRSRNQMGERSPLLVRRGGCGIKKILAKPTLAPQTGWLLTTHIPA